METLLEHLGAWKPFRALVVGDFMVDEMVYGDAERLSADAPVPVLHVRRVERNPGGAANLALALAALGGGVSVVGVVGSDGSGEYLRRALADHGVEASGLAADGSGRPTTVKRNLIGLAQQRHPQKMFRVDYESREPVSSEVGGALLRTIRDSIGSVDVVCIEDYGKGVCTPDLCRAVIAEAARAAVPVFVDPAKLTDYSRYRGCTAITPNRNEAELATGLVTRSDGEASHNVELARVLRDALGCEAVVLTLDRQGALLVEQGGEPVAVPTVARQVYDVTGAGDVFLAGLAAARVNGLGWADAVRLANVAAGLEVEVFGAQPIPIERVHQQVLAEGSARLGKLRTREQLMVELRAWRRDGKRIVFTNGCFDVLHSGHVWLLDQARRLGDVLIVATNTDARIREYKGAGRPVNGLEQRVQVLGALRAVDSVVVFEEETPAELIREIRPDVLVKGDEYSDAQIPGAAFVQGYGGEVVRVPMLPNLSSSEVLRRLGDPRAEVPPLPDRDRFIKDRA